jgi:hypothetical protein
MKRRTFLQTTAVALGGVVAWRFAVSNDEDAVVKVLYKKLAYLHLEEAGVLQFAADLSKKFIISGFRLHLIDAAGGLYTGSSLSPDGKPGRALRHGEDRVTTQYLMSSDFFINGADKTRTVKYLGYYDPMVACNNPFARPIDLGSAA